MTMNFYGKSVEVEYVRVFRDGHNIAFHALVDGQWVYFHKFKNKRIPKYTEMEWPNPQHMYGWSKPYRLSATEQHGSN